MPARHVDGIAKEFNKTWMSGEEQLDQLNVQRSTYTYPAEDDGGDVSIPVHTTALLTSAIKKQPKTTSFSKHIQWAEAVDSTTDDELRAVKIVKTDENESTPRTMSQQRRNHRGNTSRKRHTINNHNKHPHS